MKQKKSKMGKTPPPVQEKIEGISKTGKKIILSGIALLFIGFFVLTKTDPSGSNLASMVSPFLILAGYAVIGAGIIFPEKKSASPLP
ncbi:MAG: hypothetical protein A2219_08615 [Elusimicrobia bacterium RIFOXYA2_FULL_50_26]|nr:MAG: hypothetical protein A2219_08615 [Elusimicrobia bacterium RIFOXYA2_FULL_50_26]